MNGLIKKYLPYAIVIFAVFILVPLLFMKGSLLEKFSPVASSPRRSTVPRTASIFCLR